MTQRYVCIHGHFYQPPRENPWLEAVEVQDSAYPYHDWNERVTAECYAPNAASRILDERGHLARIVNTYARISFNFGPTLLAWLETARPEVYRAILEADRRSATRFGGHGSALAQAYSHLIMPLANARDRETQVLWGMRDFERRFGRPPEGMWLPETAVDVATLETLAAHGLRFTVLAPHQAARVRPLPPSPPAVQQAGDPETETPARGVQGDERPTEEPWKDVTAATVDTTRPYLCNLPSGRSIALFFYDGGLSQEIAFGNLLEDGERFARRLRGAFRDTGGTPQLVHVATDGETYGHHHRYGEMALAYALERLARDETVRVTNYAQFLELHPPEHEVRIVEDSSWSCAHGIERWRSDCGCATGGEAGWHQRGRQPLRDALDGLRDALVPLYEAAAGELLRDPWAARNAYLEVILDRSDAALDRFFAEHARRELSADERLRARRLLELQRHAMTMFTSCGWFFNDLAGIETVQVLQYADRVLQLGHRLFGDPALEERFVELLERAESNRPAPLGGTGRQIFERQVRPARVTLTRVAAHYALSSLFEDYPEEARIFCYRADQRDVRRVRSGRAQLTVGRLHLTSLLTGSEDHFAFAVLHLGDHHLNGGVRRFQGEEAFEAMATEVTESFHRADFTQVVRTLDRHFEEMSYTLDSLFRDERRAVLDLILESTRADAEAQHRRIYEDHAPLMQYLSELGIPLPLPLKSAAEVILNLDLRRAFEGQEVDLEAAEQRFRETASWHLELDVRGLRLAVEGALERLARELETRPDALELLRRLDRSVELAGALPFKVSLYGAQGPAYRLLHGVYPGRRAAGDAGDEEAAAWARELRTLAEKLELRVE